MTGTDTRFMTVRVSALAAVLLALAPAFAFAAPKQVQVTASKFDPAVVVVAPGTEVEWTNADSRTRALRGDFQSTDIAPGAKFTLRFPRVGRFDYRDRDNPAITGTVIVSAYTGGRPRYPQPGGPASRVVEHHWRATLRFDVRESWKYMDGKFMSFQGACNAQVGEGSRAVTFQASFPDVKYMRVGQLEALSGKSRPYGIQRYRELIDSKSSDPSGGRFVDCGDGSKDPPADVEQRCDHNYAGTRVQAELLWSPRVAEGRFGWPHRYLGRRPPFNANCGHGFLAGHLVGLNTDLLPWDPGAGSELLYDHGRTDPATQAETRALREGRAVTITRSLEVRFTTDCCLEWHEEGKPGTYVRVGAQHVALGKVTITFVPR
jgi:plastocyanin